MRVAIIPARGGSRGVPRKNLMSIAGRPILRNAISCCERAGVDRVVVSTDSPDISEMAIRYGAAVVLRPDELAGDHTGSQPVLAHALRVYPADEVAFVQCTAPMLAASDVCGCFDKLPAYDIVACCCPFDGVVLDQHGHSLNRPIGASQRRQDQPPQFVVNGGCWAFRPDYLTRPWMSGRVGIHLAAYPYRVEIDSWEDVWLAEAILDNLFHRHRQHDLPDGRHGVREGAAVA